MISKTIEQNLLAVGITVEPTVRPCLMVHGDGVNDDSDALQAFLDGRADLIHVDGTPYAWPGAPGRKYVIAKTLIFGGRNRDMQTKSYPIRPGAWIGCKQTGIRFWSFADALAPAMLIAQAAGRLGNYFNHELFGAPTTLPWGLEIEVTNPAFPAGLRSALLVHHVYLTRTLETLPFPCPPHAAMRPINLLCMPATTPSRSPIFPTHRNIFVLTSPTIRMWASASFSQAPTPMTA